MHSNTPDTPPAPWHPGRVPSSDETAARADARTPRAGRPRVTPRPATGDDVLGVARVLADAFHDDPLMSWIVPDEDARPGALTRMFVVGLRFHHLALGGVEVTEDAQGRIAGAAVWDPPGRWESSRAAELLSVPAELLALGRAARLAGIVDDVLTAAHPTEPHWYLSEIGTGRWARGGGHGSALLRSRLDRCDAEGLPAYLESSKRGNLPYYERFGFAPTREIRIPDGPSLWAMWREPR